MWRARGWAVSGRFSSAGVNPLARERAGPQNHALGRPGTPVRTRVECAPLSMGGRTCPICGKVLRSGAEEAMSAHQRESQQCHPRSGQGESSSVKMLEAKLADVIAEGKKLGMGSGTFDESEKNAALRKVVESELKSARKDSKADKRAIKELAQSSMSAASWTQGVLDGDAKYVKGESGLEQQLAADTVGLVTAEQFRERREKLETAAAEKRGREESDGQEAVEQARKRRQAKKAKREQQERRGLSFEEDE